MVARLSSFARRTAAVNSRDTATWAMAVRIRLSLEEVGHEHDQRPALDDPSGAFEQPAEVGDRARRLHRAEQVAEHHEDLVASLAGRDRARHVVVVDERPHSVAVADASSDLATLSGVDQEKAYVAGLVSFSLPY